MVTFISKKAFVNRSKPSKKKRNDKKNQKVYYTFEDCRHNDDRTTGTGKCFTCWYLDKHSEDMAIAVYE
jgi:hypothetical protein